MASCSCFSFLSFGELYLVVVFVEGKRWGTDGRKEMADRSDDGQPEESTQKHMGVLSFRFLFAHPQCHPLPLNRGGPTKVGGGGEAVGGRR